MIVSGPGVRGVSLTCIASVLQVALLLPACSKRATSQQDAERTDGARARVPEQLDAPPRAAQVGPCPEGMVLLEPGPHEGLDPYCLGEVEATVGQFRRCVDAGQCNAPDEDDLRTEKKSTWMAGDDEMPVNFLDVEQAVQFCGFVGGRIPTSEEWIWALGSGQGWAFPWGNEMRYDRDSHCGQWDRPGQGLQVRVPCHARQYPLDRTQQGVYDMVGSLDEFVLPMKDGLLGVVRFANAIGVPQSDRGDTAWTSSRPAKVEYWDLLAYHSSVGLRCAADVRR